jgi:hypothetical protein
MAFLIENRRLALAARIQRGSQAFEGPAADPLEGEVERKVAHVAGRAR